MGYTLPDGTQPYPPPPPPMMKSLNSIASPFSKCFIVIFCNIKKLKLPITIKAIDTVFIDGNFLDKGKTKKLTIEGVSGKSMYVWIKDIQGMPNPASFLEIKENDLKNKVIFTFVEIDFKDKIQV